MLQFSLFSTISKQQNLFERHFPSWLIFYHLIQRLSALEKQMLFHEPFITYIYTYVLQFFFVIETTFVYLLFKLMIKL